MAKEKAPKRGKKAEAVDKTAAAPVEGSVPAVETVAPAEGTSSTETAPEIETEAAEEAPEVVGEGIGVEKYEKDFVILGRLYDPGMDHEPYFAFLAREAAQSGLRVSSKPVFLGTKPEGDGQSLLLQYEAEVVPA